MRPRPFGYAAPTRVAEVLDLLGDGGDAVLLAGGQSLLPLLNQRRIAPRLVIDLNRVEELATAGVSAGRITLGALTRHRWLEAMPEVPTVLADAAACVGDPAVRRRGTLGGTIAQADPGAEIPAALALLGAQLEVAGPAGVRLVDLDQFHRAGARLAPGELITGVRLDVAPRGQGGAYVELPAVRHGRNVGAAAVVTVDGSGRCTAASVVLAGGPRPWVLAAGELVGTTGPPQRWAAQARRLARDAGLAADADLLALLSICAERAVRTAWHRAVRTPSALTPSAQTPSTQVWPSRGNADHPGAGGQRTGQRPVGRDPAPSGARQLGMDRATPAGTARRSVRFTLNGVPVAVEVQPRESLGNAVRERLGLTGTHVACGVGQCGACTVLLDGAAVRSCLLLAVQADGCEVRTIESVAAGGRLHPLQAELLARGGAQCGYCTPGMVLAALSFLDERRGGGPPTRCEIEQALANHLCRCTGYTPIVAAVEAYATGAVRASAAGPGAQVQR
jgi:carbon-monoxide dehydrogenase small subunit